MSNRKWDTDLWVADNTKIKNELGWHPSVTIEHGFQKMAEWLQQHPQLLEFYERKAAFASKAAES
jgi:nucleoside-diphosphate-sugar epimerase